MIYAADKPQRGKNNAVGGKQRGPALRDPADIASKMLTEFDADGDGMLNIRELTAMLGGMRERMQQARPGQTKPGQSRAGQRKSGQGRAEQGRPKANRQGVGDSVDRDQIFDKRIRAQKAAEAFPKKFGSERESPEGNASRKRDRRQGAGSQEQGRPGGVRPVPNPEQ